MKNIILIIGIILFVTNLLFGSILSIYLTFNIWLNCGVIAVTTTLLYTLTCITLKDGFRISLSILLGIMGFIEFVLGLFAPQRYIDNWYLIAIILIVVFEAIILTITHIISKKIN
ncbi:MAG: hypothetical protein LBL58_09375 [Tannerellaceae bacterium]|jgi:hypothetical protein|nr:hypothetical protein [Tannerellaceae bacterium]